MDKYFCILAGALGFSIQTMAQPWVTMLNGYGQGGSTAPAAIAVVQAVKHSDGGSAFTNQVAISPAAGNLLVAAYVVNQTGADVTNVQDNVDGFTGWQKCVSTNYPNVAVGIWYLKNCPAGITSVTLWTSGGHDVINIIHEVSGCSTTSPFTIGEVGDSIGTSVNPLTGAVSSTPKSICFAAMTGDAPDSPATMGINGASTVGAWNLTSSSNSQETDGADFQILSVPNIIVSSPASQAHGWTGENVAWGAVMAIFH